MIATFNGDLGSNVKKLAVAVLISLGLTGLPATEAAEAKTFKSCVELQKVYKSGVSRSKTTGNKGAGPIDSPRVNAAIYNANKKLDKDKDGIVCEVVKKTTSQSPSPAPEVDATEQAKANCPGADISLNQNLKAICEVSNQSVAKLSAQVFTDRLKVKGPVSAKLTLDLTNSIEKERSEFESQIRQALEFFGEDFKSDNVYVSLFSKNEVDIAQAKFEKIAPPNLKLVQWDMVRNSGDLGCGGQAVAKLDPRDNKVKYYFVFCVDLTRNPVSYYGTFMAHELYHLVQKSNYKTFFYDNPKTSLPHWLAEGSATLMGQINQTGNYKNMYKNMWTNFPGFQETMLSGDPVKVTDYYKSLEPENIGAPGVSAKSYAYGGLASEVLLASFGYEKLREFTNRFATEPNIQESFRATYGFELADFYLRMTSYLKWWSSTGQYRQSY